MAAGEDTSSFQGAREDRGRGRCRLARGRRARRAAARGDRPRRTPRHPAELPARRRRQPGGDGRRGAALGGRSGAPADRAGGRVEDLREQTMAYIAGALRREIRRFDRVGHAERARAADRAARRRRPARRDGRPTRARPAAGDQGRSARTPRAAADLGRPGRLDRERDARDDADPREGGRRALARTARTAPRHGPGHPRSPSTRSRPRRLHNSWRCLPDQSSGCFG